MSLASYLYTLCSTEGTRLDKDDGGQFTGGYSEEEYLYCGTIYTFAIEDKHLDLIKKEVYFD